jgi:hypothetical protein
LAYEVRVPEPPWIKHQQGLGPKPPPAATMRS